MADSSFDIVSKVDRQEVANALHQAAKEISQRYDFKGVGASIDFSGQDTVVMKAGTEERCRAVLDVFQTKLVKRGVSLKSLDVGDGVPKTSGKECRLEGQLRQGINAEDAKMIGQLIREEFRKTVKATIQGDELRVSSKSRDELQAVMGMLKGRELDVALQFVNYR